MSLAPLPGRLVRRGSRPANRLRPFVPSTPQRVAGTRKALGVPKQSVPANALPPISRVSREHHAERKALVARLAHHYKDEFKGVPLGSGHKDDPAQQIASQILQTKRGRETNRKAELGLQEHPRMPHGLTAAVGDLIPDTPAEIALTVATGGAGKLVGGALKARKLARAGTAVEAATKAPTPKIAKAAPKIEETAIKPASKIKRTVAERPRPIGTAKTKVAESKPVKAAKTAANTKPARVVRKTGHIANTPLRVVGQHKAATGVVLATAAGASGAKNKGNISGAKAPFEATAKALNPVGGHLSNTLGTTARAIPGLVTAPVGMAANVGLSGYRATREAAPGPLHKHYSGAEIAAPTKAVVKQTVDFGKGLAQTFGSGDEKQIQKAIEHTYGLTPALIAGIPGAKALKGPAGAVARAAERTPGIKKLPEARHAHLKRREVARDVSAASREGVSRAVGRKSRQGAKTVPGLSPITHELNKISAGKGGRKTFRNRNQKVTPEHALKTVVEEGIRTPEHVAQALKRYAQRPDVHGAHIVAHDVLNWLKDNPEILKNKHFQRATDIYREYAKTHETSDRAKFGPQALTLGVKLPEQRLEDIAAKTHGEKFTGLNPDSPRRTQILNEFQRTNGPQVTEQFVKDVKAAARAKGLAEPAWTHDANVLKRSPEGQGLPGPPYGQRGRTAHKLDHHTTFALQKRGTADQSFEALAQGSMIEPSIKKAVNDNTARFSQREAQGVHFPADTKGKLAGKSRKVLSEYEAQVAKDKGLIGTDQVLMDKQEWGAALLNPHTTKANVDDFVKAVDEQAKEVQARKLAGDPTAKGRTYIVVDRTKLDEFIKQARGLQGGFEKGMAKIQRASGRAILGYSPAWLLSQPIAEGAQALTAVGPGKMARGLKAYKDLIPEQQRKLDAGIGGGSGTGEMTDIGVALRVETKPVTRIGPALKRSSWGRAVHGIFSGKYASEIDRSKGLAIRRAAATGHVMREYNGFKAAANKFLGKQDEIARALQGKSRKDQLAYIADHPEALKQIESYVDDTMGNWTALTAGERVASTFVIFYPFIRMSLNWVFKTFPTRHPFKASVQHYLAQSNAVALQQAQGNPSFFTGWANAPLYAGRGKNLGKPTSVVPMQRIAPGSNAFIEGVGQGASPRDLARVLTPPLSASIAAAGGYDPGTGAQLVGRGDKPSAGGAVKQFAAALAQMPAPLRVADTLLSNKPSDKLKGKPSTPTSRLFDVLQGSPRNRALRATALPFFPQKTFRQRQLSQVGKLINYKYDDPRRSENKWKIYAAKQTGDPKQMAAIDKQIQRAIFANEELQRLYNRYGVNEKELTDAARSAINARVYRR